MRYGALTVRLLEAILLLAGAASAQATVSPLLADPSPINIGASQFFLPSAAAAAAEPVPQGVQGVFNKYDIQVYGGYTFVRFYEVPNVSTDMNGFNFSAVFYPREWVGADGELIAVFGSQSGQSTHLFAGMAGPRFRWIAPRGFELWAHTLIGGTYFSPKTPYGNQGSLSYEAGGGIDVNPPHSRFGLRLEADLLGTTFFSTYQLSPKISAGIVYKF